MNKCQLSVPTDKNKYLAANLNKPPTPRTSAHVSLPTIIDYLQNTITVAINSALKSENSVSGRKISSLSELF